MAYKRSVLNSPGVTELRHKKTIVRKKKTIMYFILFIIFFIGLVLISRIKELNINKVNISGNIVIDSKEIEEVVNKNLSGKYILLFPKTNFVIYPRAKIENELKEKYKRIKNIFINDKNANSLEIIIEEHQGEYLWCGTVIPELDSRSEQKCYFADNEGYIFDEAPYFSGEIYLKFYGKINEEGDPVGGKYFSNLFAKLIEFKNILSEMDFKPAYIWVNNQEEIIIGLSKLGIAPISPSIYLKTDADLEKATENLESAINTEPLQTKLKKDYSKLQYIDLRYGNKVYYKFE